MKERQANAANHGRFEARLSSLLPIATGRRVDAYSTCPLRPACLPRYHPRQGRRGHPAQAEGLTSEWPIAGLTRLR
jgi:hypothetical protein